MALHVYGKVAVTTGGTPVQIDADGLGRVVQSLIVQSLASNTDKIYLGRQGMVKATGVGVIAVLTPTAAPFKLDAFGNGFKTDKLYLDAAVDGEGAYISAIVA